MGAFVGAFIFFSCWEVRSYSLGVSWLICRLLNCIPCHFKEGKDKRAWEGEGKVDAEGAGVWIHENNLFLGRCCGGEDDVGNGKVSRENSSMVCFVSTS